MPIEISSSSSNGIATMTVKGNLFKTEQFLKEAKKLMPQSLVSDHVRRGEIALASATPTDTGLAAGSWGSFSYSNGSVTKIVWTNSDVENGFPVALMLQHGYATGSGGYVPGRDYINKAMKPIFDDITKAVWKAVTKA